MADRRPLLTSLDALFRALAERGYELVGPTVRDGAIVYDHIDDPKALPVGWTEVHAAGSYALAQRDDAACFGYPVGPHAWKRFLHPSALRLWRAERGSDGSFRIDEGVTPAPRRAFIGVRPCDLAAIAIQDRVFTGGAYVDRDYQARRAASFIVAVHCSEPGGTCFCASMGTGPRAAGGFDLALTELLGDAPEAAPRYLLEIGSERGAEVADRLGASEADEATIAAADQQLNRAAERMGRHLDTHGLAEALQAALDHPHWDSVAQRCLACGNCTLACPTCFCTTVEDTTDLTGSVAERTRRWDSCFTLDLSYIHGGAVRPSLRSRYRQWLTHKLATWQTQFGTSGCVGCGRCITWCPAAIDLTVEAATIAGARPAATPLAQAYREEVRDAATRA